MFSVAILSLRDATEEEVQSGVVGGFAAMGGGCCGGGGCVELDMTMMITITDIAMVVVVELVVDTVDVVSATNLFL